MLGWTVSETAQLLRGMDLEGPAAICAANGVTGADLMDLTVPVMHGELGLTLFAAKKVQTAKEHFLT